MVFLQLFLVTHFISLFIGVSRRSGFFSYIFFSKNRHFYMKCARKVMCHFFIERLRDGEKKYLLSISSVLLVILWLGFILIVCVTMKKWVEKSGVKDANFIDRR